MEIVQNIALISINETLVVQLVSFLIFIYLINRIMLRPLSKTMNDRDGYIYKIREDIENAEQELDTVRRQLVMAEESARKEANDTRKNIEESGSMEADQIFAAARDEIEGIKQETEKEVNSQLAEARQWIAKESQTLSVAIMEKILERRLN